MKKLMIAACAIALAAGAQAAAVTWQWAGSAYNGYNNPGTTVSYEGKAAQAGTMYIFNANEAGISQQAILTALLAGKDISTLGAMDSFTTTDGKMGSGDIKTLAADYKNFAPVRNVSGIDYADYFYAMVVDDYVFLSDTANKQIQTAKDTVLSSTTIASQSAKFQGDSATFTAGGWYQTVPEPTSGLLLLLGVAGLALKRKRA